MNWQTVTKRIAKVTVYTIATVAMLFFLAAAILQIPSVQKAILQRYLQSFSQITGYETKVRWVRLIWYDRLEVRGIVIRDPEHREMIRAGRIRANYNLTDLLLDGNLNLDGVVLDSAHVHLADLTHNADTAINITAWVDSLAAQFASQDTTPSHTQLRIGEIILDNSEFILHRPGTDSIPGFDHNHFHVDVDDVELEQFMVSGDTLQFRINTMVAEELKTRFKVHELRTFFRISGQSMEFLGLHLEAGHSFIADSVTFRYNGYDQLADFNRGTTISANLNHTIIDPHDLALFASAAGQLPSSLYLSGHVNGRVDKFTWRDMDLKMGRSRLIGKLSMDGLPGLEETFINLQLSPSQMDIHDWSFLMPPPAFQRIKPLGNFQLSGNFIGFYNDFVTTGIMKSPLGTIRTDINLKVNEQDAALSVYKGALSMTDFNLGMFFNDTTTFQKVTMQGNVNGRGLTERTADLLINGNISQFGLRHYNYSNITTNARFTNRFFNGQLAINDPNLQFAVRGSIDLRDRKNLIRMEGQIDTAALQVMNLLPYPIVVQTQFRINTAGLSLDSLRGTVALQHTRVRYDDEVMSFDSLKLLSTLDNDHRLLKLSTSLGSVSLEGTYTFTNLFTDVNNIFREFMLNVKNDREALQQYYQQQISWDKKYEAEFTAKLTDLNPLFDLLDVDLQVSRNLKLEGSFTNGFTSIFKGYTRIPLVRYEGRTFRDNEIEFNGSKIHDSTRVLAMMTVSSGRQEIAKGFKTRNLLVEAIWDKGHIDLGLDVEEEEVDNKLRLKSEIDFLSDSTKMKILPSQIRLLGKEWAVNPANYTLFHGKEWHFHQLGISLGKESITLNGAISKDADAVLHTEIKDLGMDLFNVMSTEKFSGRVNGTIALSDLYGSFEVQNSVQVRDLRVNNFLIGDVKGTNEWDPSLQKFDIDFFVDRLGKRIVNLTGTYDPYDKTNPISLEARLDETQLRIIEPVLKDYFSGWDGTATGVFLLGGSLSRLNVEGSARINQAAVTINYLKTSYKFEGTVSMQRGRINLTNLELVDGFKNKATLNGHIDHQNYENFSISLDGTMRNFQVLNTSAKDNSLFYGQAYATGTVGFKGPFSNLQIIATARSEKNTRVFIPLNGTATVERSNFINFIAPRDTSKLDPDEPPPNTTVDVSGLTMLLNLEITPDAYSEIIFDIKTGDIIRGWGAGNLKLELDTKGDFSMLGSYEFEKGFYNFTLGGVINKEFTINKGSRISWFGDPYAANMTINAGYRQLVSFSPVLSDPTQSTAPSIRRKYPVEVQLKLDGPMLGPQINFDIVAPDLPQTLPGLDGQKPIALRQDFTSFKARLDEQELKKQVFSLIVLRRFTPPESIFTTSGSLYNSVSEFLSNQLSYWLSQVDQNLEVDLDLGTLDQEAFNTFQLRMSYSFLNGRLRITRDGTLSSNQYNRSEVAAIAGDWTVDYLLTPDGKFKVKMYSRSNYNALLNSLGNQTAWTTGLSLSYTQSFNQFADLVRSAHRKRRKEVEESEVPERVKERNEKLMER